VEYAIDPENDIKPENDSKPTAPPDPGFYKELLERMSDGVYFVDRDRRVLYWNRGATELTGYKAEEVVGRCCQDNILSHIDLAGRALCKGDCPLSACIADGVMREASVLLRKKDGRRVPVLVRVQPIRGDDGAIVGAIEIFSDDTARSEARRKTEAMNRLAFLDHLTQLPNRRFMEMSLDTALTEYQVHQESFGILMIDFDWFKEINDSYGHLCGDHALQQLAQTLAGWFRPTDVVGRWGGDEFLAIIGNVNKVNLQNLAERGLAMMAQTSVPNEDGGLINLSISIGATLSMPCDTAESLIQRADRLMYKSKESGRRRATID
jgi:diguanylate cyclase (GGDEF)-like protein/PAS domain S-box-containing protein